MIYTALVTPFQKSGSGVDENVYSALIEKQIDAGVHAVIVAGSTGEGQTLTQSEWTTAIKTAVRYRDRIQVLGSCGQSATAQTAERYRELSDLGVHGALISTPAYNKPPQRGIVQHYQEVAKAGSLPIMVYNIPGRTAVNILPSTMKELWKIPQVTSLKESSGNLEQSFQFIREVPAGKVVLSGDDSMNLAMFSQGAKGSVSVLSNLLPKSLVKLWKLSEANEYDKARQLQNKLMELTSLLFVESNPIPVKWCVGQLLCQELPVRLPLVKLDSQYHSALKAALDSCSQLEMS